MKPQDLRIGCWYNGGIQLNGSTQAALSATESKNFLLTKAHFEVLVGRTDWHLMINPIPLTEEWILKFGFKEIDTTESAEYGGTRYYIHNTYELALDISYQPFGEWGVGYRLEFVHQIQNLFFAIIGEELTLIEKP